MSTRRSFLVGGGAALLVGANARAAGDKDKDDDEVGPTEDLMREHGILRRLLLVYREASRRLGAGEPLPTGEVAHAATIVREFIEDYHERDEEEYLFPAFEKAHHKLADLVATLRAQHQAGRKLTADVLRFAAPAPNVRIDRRAFADALDKFVRMYEPHAAFEDTILFPAFRALAGKKQLAKLQDVFEAKEQALPHGNFEKVVIDVAKIERAFALGDLAKFTPA
jgi:hemerythrin-like domain-containing protein